MKSATRNSIVLLGLTLSIVTTGCTASPTAISASRTPSKTEPIMPASAVAPVGQSPTLTQSAPMPSDMPAQTLAAQEANSEILRLLSTNNDCSFPCLWGLVPGKTPISDAQSLLTRLSQFSLGEPAFAQDQGSIILRIPHTDDLFLYIELGFKGRENVVEWTWISTQMLRKVVGYEKAWRDPSFESITQQSSLSEILSTYGKPSKVLLFTHQGAPMGQALPMSLVLYYPDKGFMMEYFLNAEFSGNSVVGCPAAAFSNFWFWSPSDEITIDKVLAQHSGEQIDGDPAVLGRFKDIEDSTGMGIDEFYSVFKDHAEKCIETPSNLWPLPGE